MKKTVTTIILAGLSFLLPYNAQAQIRDFEWPINIPPTYSPPTNSPPSSGQTTLFIGHVDGRTLNSVSGIGISTADIDPILQTYTNLGAGFTARQAQSVFDDVDALEQDLSDMIVNELLGQSFISSANVNLDTTPLHVQLSQTNTNINLMAGGLSGNASLRINTSRLAGGGVRGVLADIFCSTLRADVSIQNVSVTGTYDAFTGVANGFGSDFRLKANDVSCSFSPFSFISNIILNDRLITRIANNKAPRILNDFLEGQSIDSMLGIRDFITSLRQYADTIEGTFNRFPQSVTLSTSQLGDFQDILNLRDNIVVNIPRTEKDISDEINKVLDVAERTVGGFRGTNLKLDIFIDNDVNNTISFIASDAQRPTIAAATDSLLNRVYISRDGVSFGGRNERGVGNLDYYMGGKFVGTDTTPYNAFTEFTAIPRGANPRGDTFSTVTENQLISGVHSFGTNTRTKFDIGRNRSRLTLFLEFFGDPRDAVRLNEARPAPPPRRSPPPRRPRPPRTPPNVPPGEEPPCPTCPFR